MVSLTKMRRVGLKIKIKNKDAEGVTIFVKQISPNRSYSLDHIMSSLIVTKGCLLLG